jgi:hypothetical protein
VGLNPRIAASTGITKVKFIKGAIINWKLKKRIYNLLLKTSQMNELNPSLLKKIPGQPYHAYFVHKYNHKEKDTKPQSNPIESRLSKSLSNPFATPSLSFSSLSCPYSALLP